MLIEREAMQQRSGSYGSGPVASHQYGSTCRG